jgi:hypothetical protein
MNKVKLLENYVESANEVVTKVEKLADEILEYKPNVQDAWSIKEHIIHLVDWDINGYIWIKSIIAQPKSTCLKLDGDTWMKNILGKNHDMHKYLLVFKTLREMIFDVLIEEPDEKMNGDFMLLPINGENVKLTIKECLESFINHPKYHNNYIDRNIFEYQKK